MLKYFCNKSCILINSLKFSSITFKKIGSGPDHKNAVSLNGVCIEGSQLGTNHSDLGE